MNNGGYGKRKKTVVFERPAYSLFEDEDDGSFDCAEEPERIHDFSGFDEIGRFLWGEDETGFDLKTGFAVGENEKEQCDIFDDNDKIFQNKNNK